MPPAIGLFEMVLEVGDLAASERFYHEVIGLPIVDRWSDDRRAIWLGVGREGFLGLWPPETGSEVAIHGGRGGRHVLFALRVPMGTLDTVKTRLESLGYPVESWDFGSSNRAIYLDDPTGTRSSLLSAPHSGTEARQRGVRWVMGDGVAEWQGGGKEREGTGSGSTSGTRFSPAASRAGRRYLGQRRSGGASGIIRSDWGHISASFSPDGDATCRRLGLHRHPSLSAPPRGLDG